MLRFHPQVYDIYACNAVDNFLHYLNPHSSLAKVHPPSLLLTKRNSFSSRLEILVYCDSDMIGTIFKTSKLFFSVFNFSSGEKMNESIQLTFYVFSSEAFSISQM